MGRLLVYVGTYTREGGRGIVVLEFCPKRGRFAGEVQSVSAEDPAYLALHPTRSVMFCVNEVRSLGGVPTGRVGEFELDPDGRLHFRRQWSSGGMTPSHLAVDPSGRWLAVANYRGDTVALGELDTAGHLTGLQPRWSFSGWSVHPERQLQAHPHQVVFQAGGVFVPVLGADEVIWHALAGATSARAKLPPGAGPRHLVFTPDGAVCYVLCELSSELVVFAWDANPAGLTLRSRHSTRGRGDGRNQAAAIKLHPGGRWLFCSNRGEDSVAIFRIGPGDTLDLNHVAPTGGRWPRDLTLTPDGRWLVVAHQHSGELAVFPFDPDAGKPGPCVQRWRMTAPACVVVKALPD